MERSISEIIEYIVVLELDIKKPYSIEDVENNFKQLSKIYHPDISIDRYKDGKRFMLLNEARAYLIDNYEYVNKLIVDKFNYVDNNEDIDYENVKSYSYDALIKSKQYKLSEIVSFILMMFELVILLNFINYFSGIKSYDKFEKIISIILITSLYFSSIIIHMFLFKISLIHKKLFKRFSIKYVLFYASLLLLFLSMMFVIVMFLTINKIKFNYNEHLFNTSMIIYGIMIFIQLLFVIIMTRDFNNIREE